MQAYLLDMLKQAEAMLEHSYSPYSEFAVGCCIKSSHDKLFAGCNVENASYGLSSCAENTAIGNMISNGGRKITEVVIIARKQAVCSPCGACRQRLAEFAAPDMKIHLAEVGGIIHKTYTLQELLPHQFNL